MPKRTQRSIYDESTDVDWNISPEGDGIVSLDGEVIETVGALVPASYNYIALTYVAAGNGLGEVETAIYKTGGSGGTTVATLTLTYDSSNRVATVTRT